MPVIFSPLDTRVMPSFLSVISIRASLRVAASSTIGALLSIIAISPTKVVSFFPSCPAGCDFAKSSLVKPLCSRSDTARASPKTMARVVEEVGAKSKGQASSLAVIAMLISPLFAIEESELLVSVKTLPAHLFSAGKISIISLVSPELDKIKIASFLSIIPRSP